MANPITEIKQNELSATLRSLGKAGATTEHSDWMRGRGNAVLLVQFIDQQRGYSEKNLYEMTVEQQLASLRLANNEEKWGIAEEDFARLASTAPAWPQGKHAYRSFRVRFGEGDDGVAKTYGAHCIRIKHVFGEDRHRRWKHFHSSSTSYTKGESMERLRLLNGNHTHHAIVEWIVVDLDTHRKRKSVTSVRDSKSLADELLVISWLFPEMIKSIDSDKLSGWFAAGYEVNVPENGDGMWQGVVIVLFDRDNHQVDVGGRDRSSVSSGYSVPVLRE